MNTRQPLQTSTTQSPLQLGSLQRKCAQCDEKETHLQRQAVNQTKVSDVPPIVHEVLNSPSQPLDAETRSFMEPRFGQDFSQVRVHTDAKAAESAQAVNANAYTIGQDIVFAAGKHAPESNIGKQLMAHELTHVVQQQGSSSAIGRESTATAEQEADAVSANITDSFTSNSVAIHSHPQALYRQAAAPTSTSMTRAEFETTMRKRFGVTRIRTGTQQEQEGRLTPMGGAPAGGIHIPNWQAWDPGTDSSAYESIIQGFEDFNLGIGGVPVTKEIVFFETDYELNSAGVPIRRPGTGASFGAGRLTIYKALTTSDKPLPIARSDAKGTYPSVVIGVSMQGSSPGAPLPLPSRDESIRRMITHELGHGLAEAAMGPNPATAVDPQMINDYQMTVGWTSGNPSQLFDAGVPAVVSALKSGQLPPANYEIKPDNWNSPQWVEQPLTLYSVMGGPSEDFAEAVMVYIRQPNLLMKRSPHRFDFLDKRKNRWLPKLLKVPQIGDFPEPRKDQAVV
jgi:hypothetical protein